MKSLIFLRSFFQLSCAFAVVLPMILHAQTKAELNALNNLPIDGYVVFTNGDTTSEMGRGCGVYRFNLKSTTLTTINTRGRWATIHPSGSIIAYAKPVTATDLPKLQTQYYHIVLTDMNGIELCRLSRDSIPNVFALAWTDDNRIIYGASNTLDGMNGYPTAVYVINMAGLSTRVKDNVLEIPTVGNPQNVIVGVSELAVAGTHILFRRGMNAYLADYDPANPQNGWTNERRGEGDYRCGTAISYDGMLTVLNTFTHNKFELYQTANFPASPQEVNTVADGDDYHFVSNAGNKALFKQWLVFCTQINQPRDIYVVNKDVPASTRVSWLNDMGPTKPFLWLRECTDNTAPTRGPVNPTGTVISSSNAHLAWGAAVEPDCGGITHYRISRHNETTSTFKVVGISFTTSFDDLLIRTGQVTTYGIQAVNSNGLLSPMATLSVNNGSSGDIDAPRIQDVFNSSKTTVWIVFDETIDSLSTVVLSHFSINNSIRVIAAKLSADYRSIGLTTSELTNGQSYTVSVTNIKDRAVPANTLSLATASFTALIVDTVVTSADTLLTILAPQKDTIYHLGDTLKMVWCRYNGSIIPTLSVDNGKTYPIALSDKVVWSTSCSWIIPKDGRYISDSVRVKITDIYSSHYRRSISGPFRIGAASSVQQNPVNRFRMDGKSKIILVKQDNSLAANFETAGRVITSKWQMRMVSLDGRTRLLVRPHQITNSGSMAQFKIPGNLAGVQCAFIAIVQDEHGVEVSHEMLSVTR